LISTSGLRASAANGWPQTTQNLPFSCLSAPHSVQNSAAGFSGSAFAG